jgi:hypothetical protein
VLKNAPTKHNKYVDNEKVEHLDEVSFRKLFIRIRVDLFLSALASLMPFTILPAVPAGTITDNILPPPLI